MAERPFAPLHVGCLPGGVIGLHGLMTLDAVINLKVDGSVGPACDAKSTPGRPPGSMWRHNLGGSRYGRWDTWGSQAATRRMRRM